MLLRILIPIAAMASLGLMFGIGLAYALKVFGVKIDEKVMKILSMLPGTNCGACGKAGCSGFAEALASGEADPTGCAVSNDQARKSIAKYLGLEATGKVKKVARLLCNGGTRSKDKYTYIGISNCKAASLVFGGYKACSFGCLGLGDCIDVCPFGAIRMGDYGLPVVDESKCTACGKCLKTCPKNLFELVPVSVKYYVKCSSKDPGGITARNCKAGCIACTKCVKACPNGALKVENNLSRIDAQKCKNIGECLEVCPTGVIVKGE